MSNDENNANVDDTISASEGIAEGGEASTLRPPAVDPAKLQELDEAAVRFEGQKRWQDLIRTLQAKAELVTEREAKVELYERIAGIYLERFSNQAEAIKANEAIVEVDPENGRALTFLKAMYEKRRDWDKLVAILRAEAQSAPRSEQLERWRALARFVSEKIKRPELCTEIWEAVLGIDGDDPEALGQLAVYYEKARDYSKLAAVLRAQAVQVADAKEKGALLTKLGTIASDRINDDVLAVEAWRGVLALDPNDRRAQEALKKRYLALHAWDDLEAFYAESGRWDELIRLLEREAENTEVPVETRVSLLAKVAELWAVRKEKTDRAARYLEKVLELDPGNRPAALRLVPIYTQARTNDRLAAALEVKLHGDEGEERLATLRALAELYENPLVQPVLAFERYRAAFEAEPGAPRSIDDLERAAGPADAWPAVVAAVRQALASGAVDGDPSVVLRLRLAAVLSDRLGDTESATTELRHVLEAEPAHAEALGALERLLRANKKWPELLEVLDRRLMLADGEERRALLFDVVHVSEVEQGDLTRAVHAASSIVGEFGDDPEALAALDRLYEKLSQWDDLARILSRELEVSQTLGDDDKGPTLRFRLASVLEQHLGRTAEALALHREILSLAPEHEGSRAALERALRDPELRRDAAATLQPVYELRGDWEALVKTLEILAVDEESPSARVELLSHIGQVSAVQLGDPRRALDAYGRAFRDAPGDDRVRETLVNLAEQTGNWAEVVTLFREASMRHSGDELGRELLVAIAEIEARQLGNVDNAVAALEQVLTRDPSDAVALRALERIWRAAGRWPEVLTTLRRRLDVTSDAAAYDKVMSDIAAVQEDRLGDADAAIATWREVLDRDPGNGTALGALDRLFTRNERWRSLAENLGLQLSLTDSAEAQTALQLRLAEVFDKRLADPSAAIDLYRQVLTRDPENHPAVSALEALLPNETLTPAVVEILEPVYRETSAWPSLVAAFETWVKNTDDRGLKVELLHRVAELHENALGDGRAAFVSLSRALAEDPSRDDTLNALDQVARGVDGDAEFIGVLDERIAATDDPSIKASLHRRAATVAEERRDDIDGAIEHQRAIVAIDSKNLDAVTALERLYQLADKPKELAETLWAKSELVDDLDERKTCLWRAAEIEETVLGDVDAAVRTYRKIAEVDDGDAAALDALVRIFIAGKRWPELLEVYEKKADLIADPDEKKRLYFEVAAVWQSELKDGARAVDAYNRVLELDPTDLVAIQRLDHLYSEQGRWQELLGILEREADLAADVDEVSGYRFRTAQLYETHLDDVPRAVEIYRGILEVDSEHQAALAALVAILHGDREPLAAAEVLEPLFTSTGQFDRVVEVLEVEARCVEDQARKVELLQRIAEVRETVLDDSPGALDALSRAVRVDPHGDENLANFERIAGDLDAWDSVARVYDEAAESLSAEPERQAELYARAGQLHEVQRGDVDAAIARYEKVLAVDAENPAALRSLDRLYESRERWADQADVIRRQVALADLSPDENIELRHRLGVVLESRLGDTDSALAIWREILDIQGDHPPTVSALEALFDRGVRRAEVSSVLDPIYRMGEEWEKLASLQSRGLDLVTDPDARREALHGLADIAENKLSDPTTAFEWVGRALREQPLDERNQSEVERLAEQTNAWAELTNVYADILEAENASDEVRLVLGKKLARVHEEALGDLASAEGAYQFVLDVSPTDADALEALDRIYSAEGEAEKLAVVLDRRAQTASDPDDKVEHLSRLARILHDDLGRSDDAVARYREIIEQVDGRHRPSLDALETLFASAEKWPELYSVYQRKLDVADSDDEQAELCAHMAGLAEGQLGRPDDAVQLYERVLSLRGEESGTLGSIAALHESAGRWAELIEVLERQLAAEVDPDQRVAIALRIARVYHERLGDAERAIEGYRRVLDLEPASFDALRALASIYREHQAHDDLVATLQTLISLGAGSLEDDELKAAYAELGRIYWHTLDQPFEAVDAWRHVLDLEPGNSEAIEALLAIHVAHEEWRDVVEVLERKAAAAQTVEERVAIHLQAAGVWQEHLGDPDGARPQWEAILEAAPLHDQAFTALEALHRDNSRWEDLASLYVSRHDQLVESERVTEAVPFMVAAAEVFDQRLGDREQAFAAAQIAFDEDVSNESAVAILQRLTTATGKWNEVLKSTYEAYEAEPAGPRKTELGLHVARWYGLEHDRPDWAIPIYTKILSAEPDNVKALRALGALYHKTGQWQPLAKTLQRVVDAARGADDKGQAHRDLGEVYERQLGAPEAAVEQYESAVSLDPRDVLALSSLARVWQSSGDWARVVDALRRQVAATDDPTEVTALKLHIGEVLEDHVGDLEGAVGEFSSVLESDPSNLDALRGLERLYAKMGRSAELLHVLELQLDIPSTERERIKLLTRIAEMLEEEFVRPDQAIERFEQIVEIDPTHDTALRGLERLYRSTGKWHELVSALERHLVATAERRDRVPIFLQMGRVYADELHDGDHAEDAFLNVLQIDAQNTDALDALSRIYESRGDWHRALDVLDQLSSLLVDDPRRAVELRFRVGRIAEGSLGDEDRAIESYQSALDVDDGYQPALEALRTLFTRREDWAMAARFLDREQSVTEQPRHRAKLLTELGNLYNDPSRLDDLDQAVRLYEEALRADPDEEEAALPLLRQYTMHERWAEAEPLAELLGRRAGRRDPAEQLEIQLMAGRVAAALGRTDKAIKAFTAAQSLDRANVEAISSLARAYYDKQDWENAFKHFQVLLVHHKDELDGEARADLYYRLGVVKREQSDRRRAINFFEKALEEFPGHRPTLDAMVELYASGGEWEQSLGYRQQILDNEFDEERRFAMLVEIGGLWHEKVKNPQRAIQAIAGASELKPGDHVLLHKLLGLYQETRQWSKVIDVVQRVSDLERDPARRSKYAYTIASIYNQELKSPDEALEWYNTALDHNPQDPKPFVKINEVLTARRDWKNLERSYRKMLLRIAGKGDADLEFRLLHALGLIYRDRLSQNDNAIRTFEMASRAKPDDVTENKILAELYTRENRISDAVERWQKNIAADVGDTEALHAVFDLYYQSRQYDKAWCVGATTTFVLRERAREDVRTFYEQYRPRRPLAPTGRLTEEHWVKKLFHPNEDPVVGKIFASILQPLRNIKSQPLAAFQFTQAELQNPQTSSVALVKSLALSAQALSLPLPHIFLRASQQGGLGYVPSEPIASVSGSGLLSGLTPQDLAFVAAKHLAYYRNEHYIRTLFPTTQELTALLLAAIKLVKPDQDVPPEALSTAQQLGPKVAQDPIASEGLRKVVRIFLEQGGQSNIKRWYQSVELTAARAGFLMCGDLEVARKMLSMEPGLPGDLSPTEKLKDVILFSISETYFELRDALGINFQSAATY